MITKICPQCNKSFETIYSASKFCSRKCAAKHLSKKVEHTCPYCNKIFIGHKNAKFCSRKCANSARRGVRLKPIIMKICPVCNNSFESKYPSQQFCSRKCGQKGRRRPSTYNFSPETREMLSNNLKQRWKEENFRQNVIDRMTHNNPSFNPDVIQKAKESRAKNGKLHNNFKYGNGKISPYEQRIKDKLDPLGFIYNHPIITKPARDANPGANYAHHYKPDFVNLDTKLCIEIDGDGHSTHQEKLLDFKKETCLHFLGYDVIRFTHDDIDEGVFDAWLNSYQKNI